MTWVLTIAGFVALIVLHEFGHFVVAKWTGMRVERFFLFFPPKLWSVRRGETEYGIGAIPLGGFVKITGMNPEELEPRDPREEKPREAGLLERVESADQGEGPGVSTPGEPLPPELRERAYYNQPVWKRIVVIAAGPVVNILIAFVILFALAFTIEQAVGSGVQIDQVQDDTPAAGTLEPGDRIVSIDGVPASNLGFEDRIERFRDEVDTHKCAGEQTDGCATTTPVEVVVERDGRRVPVSITPEYNAAAERSLLGVVFGPVAVESADYSVPQAADFAADRIWFITSETVSTISRIFLPEEREKLSGPVGGSRALNEAIGFDWRDALLVLAVISLSLGLINLFPFLPLDGGHIFWSLVEKVRGERVPFRIIESASAFGFLLVLVLFAIGLSNDISNLGDDALNPNP